MRDPNFYQIIKQILEMVLSNFIRSLIIISSRQHVYSRLQIFGRLIRSLSMLTCYFQVVPRVKNACCFEVLNHPLGK